MNSNNCVTVQIGLRIYCTIRAAGRVKERRLRVSAPLRSDLEWQIPVTVKVSERKREAMAGTLGVTESEVFAALEEYNLFDRKEEVKQWYNGFAFGIHRN